MTTKTFDIMANLGMKTDTKAMKNFNSRLKSVTTGVTRVNDGLKKMGKVAVASAAVVAGAFAAVFAKTAKVANEMATQENIARGLGVAGEDIRALGFAFGTVGLEAADVTDTLKSMNETLGRFKINPTKRMESAFSALGVNSKELMKLDPAKQMEKLYDAAVKMGDDQKAQAAMAQIFGGKGSAVYMALKESGKSFAEFRDEGKKLDFQNQKSTAGAIRFKAAMDDMGARVGSLKKHFFGLLSESLSPLVEKLNNFIAENKELISLKIEQWAKKVGKAFEIFAEYIEKVWNYFSQKEVMDQAKQIFSDIAYVVGFIASGFKKIIDSGHLPKILKLLAGFTILLKISEWVLKIVGFFGKLIGFAKFLFPILKAVGAFIASTGGMIIALAGVIIYSFYKVYKSISENWSFLSAEFSEMWNNFKAKLASVADFFVEKWQKVKDFFSDLYKNYIQPIVNAISSMGKGIGRFFRGPSASADQQTFRRGTTDGLIRPRAVTTGPTNVKNDINLNFGSTNASPNEIARQVERTIDRAAKQTFRALNTGVE